MNTVIIKLLNGDSVSLNLESNTTESILEKINAINPIQYPLKRTFLVKDNMNEEKTNTYYAYIEPYLTLGLTHYDRYNQDISDEEEVKDIVKNPNRYSEESFEDGLDGKVYDEFRGVMSLDLKFKMPTTTMYKLYVVSIINCRQPIITYKYDAVDKDDYMRVSKLIRNKDIKLNENLLKDVTKYLSFRDDDIIVLDCNGNIVYSLSYDHYTSYK